MFHTSYTLWLRIGGALAAAVTLVCLLAFFAAAAPNVQEGAVQEGTPSSPDAQTVRGAADLPVASTLAPGYCPSSGGSTSYESIRSLTLKPKANSTLELTVQVFIANPTGCQSGEPCPQYDNSPENVNAWIDWNGDKVWDASERVMDKALTGYGGINYGGSMTTIGQISVPEGVTSTTWLRANLAWGDDANDPCRSSWGWGNVVDQQVSVAPPKIKAIKVKGSRDPANPMTAYDVTVEAELDTPAGYEITKVTWTGDIKPGDGNPYTYRPDKGAHGQKKIKATVSYKHTATGVTGQVAKEHEFKLFFEKKGDEDGDGNPNWFEHWGSDGAVTGLSAADVLYSATKSGYGSWSNGTDKLTLGAKAAETHYASTLTIAATTNCPGGTFGGAKGIDSVAEVIAHERQHETFWENWNTNGTWTIGTTTDTDDPTPTTKSDIKGDMMPDSYETGTSKTDPNHLDSCDLEHKKSSDYKWYGDEEFMAIKAGDGKTGVPAKDWANPGKQSSPPFAAVAAAAGNAAAVNVTPTQRSGPALVNAPHDLAQEKLPDLASLAGTYADRGVDSAGDSRFELLRIDVGVEVVAAGAYSVRGWLYDATDAELAWAVTAANLTAGSQSVALEFDGRLIRQHGSAGPYSLARVELVIGDRDVLVDFGDDVHTTAAYGADAFVPPAVTFTGAFADRGVDSNGASSFERLAIDVGVEVNTLGSYTVLGWLHDAAGTPIPYATASTNVNTSGLVTLAFDGKAIAWQRADGPYQLRGLEVRDAAGNRIGYVDLAHTTGAYIHNQFGSSAAGIDADSYADRGIDADGDGKFDYLQVELTVNIPAARSTTISAHLAANQRTTIAAVEQEISLSAGVNTVVLQFPAGPIRAAGVDGPYLVTDVTLIDDRGDLLDHQKRAHTTAAYAAGDFDAPLIALTGAYTDRAVDDDGDGRKDWLEIAVTVLPGNSGSVQLQGWLADSNGTLFVQAETDTVVAAGEAIAIPLRFDAAAIAGHGVDGPYHLRNLLVYHAGDPSQAVEIVDAHTTASYRAADLAVVDKVITVHLPLVVSQPAEWDPCTTPPSGESDNVADAIVICSGQTATGRVSETDRDDVYRIDARPGQELTVALTGTGGDADLYLYPPGTTDITVDPAAAGSLEDGNDELIRGTILTGGIWYIDVYAYAGSTDYRLSVNLVAGTRAASVDLRGDQTLDGPVRGAR